jgi:histidinol-phosphate aminotransferase
VKDPLRHVKPVVRGLRAYTLAARPAAVKLDQNENPFDLPEDLKRRVVERALRRPWSRYPEFDPRELVQALAAWAGVAPEGVVAGNGSNELIEALLRVTVGAGTSVVVPEPTFTLYGLLTRILGGELLGVPLGPRFEYDAAALCRAARERAAALTIVCSPNNPTGTSLGVDDVAWLCRESDGLVVVDEAYHEFSGRSVVPLLSEHPNLVVLRTFSKAMAMAGLRVGYLLAAPALAREIDKARLPYNVNFFSQQAALAVLGEPAVLTANVTRLVQLRDELFAALSGLRGVRPVPSQANFILFELQEGEPRAVFEALFHDGVLVRDVSSYPRLGRCLRVSVGSEAENARFLASLRKALAADAVTSAREAGR